MAKVKVKVTPGKPTSGTKLATQTVRISKKDPQTKPYGKPLLQTRAEIHLHIQQDANGNSRPVKTELKRAN